VMRASRGASGAFAVDLMFVLGELTIKAYNNSYLATC